MTTRATSTTLRSPDRLVDLAAVGVRCAEYTGHDSDGLARTFGATIEGLHVRAIGSSEHPIYHPSNGVYGFRTLAPGPHRVHIEDPQGRFLPRAVEVTVHDDVPTWRAALARGAQPDWSGWNPVSTVALYPAPGRHIPPAETVVYGDVIVDDDEVPFARVEIDGPDGKVVTYTDQRGTYVTWLRDERSHIDTSGDGSVVRTFERTVRAFRLTHSPEPGRELFAFPVDFDDEDALASGDTWQELSLSESEISFEIGETKRLRIHLP